MAASYYRLTGKKFTGKGQARQVYDVLVNNAKPMLVEEITKGLKLNPNFKTEQSPLRVAAYYICLFNKDGIVEKTNDVVVETLESVEQRIKVLEQQRTAINNEILTLVAVLDKMLGATADNEIAEVIGDADAN